MNKLYFMNKGEFNPTAMMTFGVSAKEKDNAIGKFGTGFKYSVAIILRMGGSIKVTSLDKEFVFTTKEEVIRGKSFDVVYMNNQNAGFTTHLGTNWEAWMAFRELYCNALDEGGVVSEVFVDTYDTYVEVDCLQLYEVFEEKSSYFLNGEPLFTVSDFSHEIEVHPGVSGKIYYQGVAVYELDRPSLYTYNILHKIDLTEERIARYVFQIEGAVNFATQMSDNKEHLRGVLKPGDHYEVESELEWAIGASQAFKEVCEELFHTDVGVSEAVRLMLRRCDLENGVWPELLLTKLQLMALNKAKEFLLKLHINVEDYPIHTVTGLGVGVMGRAYEGGIYLSELPFQMGVKQLASTLMEEWVHLKTGARDFDRTMQNYLFDKVLSTGEEMTGELL